MKEVFVAAECGMYEREQGVHQLLANHMLPATITDQMGRSIIHYMTSTTAMDGRPPWAPKDIRKFLKDHEYFINAVDHWGKVRFPFLQTFHFFCSSDRLCVFNLRVCECCITSHQTPHIRTHGVTPSRSTSKDG